MEGNGRFPHLLGSRGPKALPRSIRPFGSIPLLPLLLGISVVLALPGPVRAGEPFHWSGLVLDLLGRGIPGVEVLAYPSGGESPGASPRIFLTDERGRFRLSGLEPGRYFLALNKPGYQVLMAQVNSRWISRLTLTLIPGAAVPGPPPATQGGSMDWVLRVPRSDLLKEIRPGDPVAAAAGAPDAPEDGRSESPEGGPAVLARLPFNGEVEQWFTTDPSFAGGGSDLGSSSGRTTSLRLDGDLLGRGNWQVGGIMGSLSTGAGQGSPGGGERDEGAGRLRVAMNYDLSPEDSVRFHARYDQDSFRDGTSAVSAIPPVQEVRTLGYQAGWVRKMDEGAGLEMKVGFLEALGRGPGDGSGPGTAAGSDTDNLLQDRRWDAGALYGFNLSPEHRFLLRAATRVYNYGDRSEGWILVPIQSDVTLAETGQRGWSVSVSGEDAWKISDPLSIIVGLDYHRAESEGGFSAVVPRLGARRESDRSLIQGQILFRLDGPAPAFFGSPAESGPAPAQESCVGYRAEVLRRLGGTWTVSGHAERNPLGPEVVDGWTDSRDPTAAGALLLADASSVTEELGLEVSKKLKGVKGTLGTDQGRVRGRVTAHLDGAPIEILGPGEIRYLTLKASASVSETDTEVRLDYSRLDGLDSGLTAGDSGQASRFDVRVLQLIPFLGKRLPADWRVLVAYQSLYRDSAGAPETGGGLSPERVRRLSGGVGVRF